MHRLTATDTPMVRYTRTIFPSYAESKIINKFLIFFIKSGLLSNKYHYFIEIAITIVIKAPFSFFMNLYIKILTSINLKA